MEPVRDAEDKKESVRDMEGKKNRSLIEKRKVINMLGMS